MDFIYSDTHLGIATLRTNPSVPPKNLPHRSLPIALPQPVKVELDILVKRGDLVPVKEPMQWMCQIVREQNGMLRLCIDPQPLNQTLMREHYKLATLSDVLQNKNNAKMFSKLDVQEAFWLVELDTASSLLTTMITPYGR